MGKGVGGGRIAFALLYQRTVQLNRVFFLLLFFLSPEYQEKGTRKRSVVEIPKGMMVTICYYPCVPKLSDQSRTVQCSTVQLLYLVSHFHPLRSRLLFFASFFHFSSPLKSSMLLYLLNLAQRIKSS